MPANLNLLKRIIDELQDVPNVEERRMFSGITFMVNGKMCISVGKDRLMCRIDPSLHDEVIKKPGVSTVIMRGRPYHGFVYVDGSVVQSKADLDYWVMLCLDYNKIAKSSKKRKA